MPEGRLALCLGILVLLMVGLASCKTHQADLKLAATHGSGLAPVISEGLEFSVKRNATGRSRAVTSILFVPTPWRPSLAEALAAAAEDVGGGAVLSAQVWSVNWWFGVSVSELRVQATVAQIEAGGAIPTGRGEFAALSNDWVRPRFGTEAAGERVEGVESELAVHHILWIPTRPSPPRLEDALDDAIDSGVGDLLVDADVEYTWWSMPFIYGVERWRIRGDSLRSSWVRTGRIERPPAREARP